MYIIVVSIEIAEGHKEEFIKAMLVDARGSLNNEPGCLRFDVIQDGGDANKIWLYEVYADEAAYQAHTQQAHFLEWRETTKDWIVGKPLVCGKGSHNIWPTDAEWK